MKADCASLGTRDSVLESRRVVPILCWSCAVVQLPEREARRRDLASAAAIADTVTHVIVGQILTLPQQHGCDAQVVLWCDPELRRVCDNPVSRAAMKMHLIPRFTGSDPYEPSLPGLTRQSNFRAELARIAATISCVVRRRQQ